MQRFHLLPACMGQHTAMFEDEQGLCDAGALAAWLGTRFPPQRLQLHLPIHTCKVPTLLQYCLRCSKADSASSWTALLQC